MTRAEQQLNRQHALSLVCELIKSGRKIPSYQKAVAHLNAREIRTIRGNIWTEKRLFRFLQNAGYSGLWGLNSACKVRKQTNEIRTIKINGQID